MKIANVCLIGLVFVVCAWAEPLLEGRVRLESGAPVADAQVRLFDLTDLRQGAVARAQTDGTGYFALPLAALRGRALPEGFALGPNYPNPFNPSTIIPYQLAVSSAVRLEVFNLLGQRIATLVDGERPAGFHTATWHATDAAGRAVGAGVYIYRMTVGVESQTGRMVLLDGQAGVSAGGMASVMPGASDGGGADGQQVYGLIVSGEGLAPYVDSSFRIEAGMAPVELVVSSGHSGGKAADDDCAFCDLFDALNDDDEGPGPSGKAQATLAAPPAPTNLRFEAVTDSSCTVRWDAAEGATDYDVNYKPAVGGEWTNEPHRGTGLSNTINDLEPDTEYRWAVRAENGDGPSEWVFGPNFTTLADETDETAEEEAADGQAPAAPTNLRFEAVTDSSCTVRWDAVEGATDYDVNYKPAVGGRWTSEPHRGTGLSNTINDLAPGTEYRWAVRAENGDGRSTWAFGPNFTTVGADGQVTIPDAKLRAAIEAVLGKASGATITVADMTRINRLEAGYAYAGFSDLTGLEFATNLTLLNFSDNQITDLSPLTGLTSLKVLGLSNNQITDLSALSGLTNLWWLDLGGQAGNQITDISALSGLTNLSVLYLWNNRISDISALSGLTNLTHLYLWNNRISDISALSGLTRLTELNLDDNPLSASSINDHIPALQARGVEVTFRTAGRNVVKSNNELQTPPPTWIFAGDVPLDDQAELQEEMECVRAFFSNRYGVEATGFTVVVGKDYESFNLAMEDETGFGAVTDVYITPSKNGGAVIGLLYGEHPQDSYFSGIRHAIAHEYFHALQGQLATEFAPLESGEIAWRLEGASWLVEGLASYADYVYSPYRVNGRDFLDDRYTPYEDLKWERDVDIRGALGTHLNSLNQKAFVCGFSEFSSWFAYALSFVASIFLSEQGEENSYVEYWRLLHDRPWQEAFKEAFGISVERFYEAFYEWYPSAVSHVPDFVRYKVLISWPGIQAGDRVMLVLEPRGDWPGEIIKSFEFPFGDPAYARSELIYEVGYMRTAYLGLWVKILDEVEIVDEGQEYFLGWYKNGELTAQLEEATLIEFPSDYSSTIKWVLPAHPATLPRTTIDTID